MDNSTQDMSEMLIQYLDGELDNTGQAKVELALASNAALRQELEDLKLAREAVRLYGLNEKVTAVHRQMKTASVPVRPIQRSKVTRYAALVAASILLIIAGIFFYDFVNLSPNKVFSAQYYTYELTTMRDDDTVQKTPVERAYREKDYRKTIEAVYQNGRSALVRDNFLAAMAYSNLGNSSSAIEFFNHVIELNKQQNTREFVDEAEYFLALNYIRNGENNKALELLRKIKSDRSHLYHDRVTAKLIRQVKMLKWR